MPRIKKTLTKKVDSKEKVQKPKTKVKVVAKMTQKKDSGLKTDVYDMKGKVVDSVSLSKEIFGAKINPQLMSQAVRVYLANQRIGTASTKTRGEVHGSSRKIYRQKGTGRARHGSIRAPIFVHGGIVFGPKPRDYSLKLPSKMKKAALFSALSAKLKDGEIKVIDGLDTIEAKTKQMVQVLKNLALDSKNNNILLIIPPPSQKGVENVVKAVRNIKGVAFSQASQLNAYEVLRSKAVVFLKDSILTIRDVFLKEEK